MVWKWFLKFAKLEETSAEEREANRPYVERFGKSWEVLYKLTPVTEFFIRDIGMLFGQLLYDELGTLEWGIGSKPKNNFFYNHPVLKGFPGAMEMDPIHIVGTPASRLLSDTADEKDLIGFYNAWLALRK